MDRFDELLEKLNLSKITQTSIDWEENIPIEIWEEYLKGKEYSEVETGLDVEKHRWYEISTTVVKVLGRYLGIEHISELYSEEMTTEDCYHTMRFYEMKEIQTISYTQV